MVGSIYLTRQNDGRVPLEVRKPQRTALDRLNTVSNNYRLMLTHNGQHENSEFLIRFVY